MVKIIAKICQKQPGIGVKYFKFITNTPIVVGLKTYNNRYKLKPVLSRSKNGGVVSWPRETTITLTSFKDFEN